AFRTGRLPPDRSRRCGGFGSIDRHRTESALGRCSQAIGHSRSGTARQSRGEGDGPMTELMEKGSSFVRDLGEAARDNPISAALIGMGILWMFGGSAKSVARRARVDRMLDRAGEASEATSSIIRSTGA